MPTTFFRATSLSLQESISYLLTSGFLLRSLPAAALTTWVCFPFSTRGARYVRCDFASPPAYRFYRPLQTPPPDYETILSRLSTEISEAKTNLSEIKLRERRYMLLLNAYSLLLWLIWTGLWWLNGLPWGLVGLRTEDPLTKAIGSGLTLLSPLG
jgi:hypothetical protein